MKGKEKTIEELQKKINFWKKKLEVTKNTTDAAVIADKISRARAEIKELSVEEPKKEIKCQIDAPAMADNQSSTPTVLERGQIMDVGEVFVTGL